MIPWGFCQKYLMQIAERSYKCGIIIELCSRRLISGKQNSTKMLHGTEGVLKLFMFKITRTLAVSSVTNLPLWPRVSIRRARGVEDTTGCCGGL